MTIKLKGARNLIERFSTFMERVAFSGTMKTVRVSFVLKNTAKSVLLDMRKIYGENVFFSCFRKQ